MKQQLRSTGFASVLAGAGKCVVFTARAIWVITYVTGWIIGVAALVLSFALAMYWLKV